MYELERTFWWFEAKRMTSGAVLARARLGSSSVGSQPRRPPRILDAGCGTGGNLEWLATKGTAFGVDLSETALKFCGERIQEGTSIAPDTRPRPKAVACGELLKLPFADGSFDLVTAFDVLYHKWVTNDLAAMKELARVCRPGGYVLITDSALPFLRGPHDEAYGGARRYTRRTLRRVVEGAGCRVVRMSYFHFLLFPLIAAVRLKERWSSSPDQASSDLKPVHPVLNRLLKSVYRFEAALLRAVSLPWGSSIVCLARKPD